MQPIEIIVLISAILIVGVVFGSYLYKKLKHIPTGECEGCKHKNTKKMLNKVRKEIEEERICNCK
jgi:hypothetical protein